MKGLTLDFQFRNGYKGTKYWDGSHTTLGTKHTLYQIMATYGMGHDFRVGANYVNDKAKRNADTVGTAATVLTYQEDKSTGYDIWGWTDIAAGVGAFGRYEHKKVQRTTTAGINALEPSTNRYVLGLEYKPVKNIAFSLVYDYKKTKDNSFVTGDEQKDTTYGLFSNFKY